MGLLSDSRTLSFFSLAQAFTPVGEDDRAFVFLPAAFRRRVCRLRLDARQSCRTASGPVKRGRKEKK